MRSGSRALRVNNLLSEYGEDWVLRFIEGVELYGRSSAQLAADHGLTKDHINTLRLALFTRGMVEGKPHYCVRPEVRAQLNEWEEHRLMRRDRVLDYENRVLSAMHDPDRLRLQSDEIAIEGKPGLSRAMNEQRAKMGEKTFRVFLHYLRGPKSIFEIADHFKKYGIHSYQVQLWRRTVTRPTRAVINELSRFMAGPLELVPAKPAKSAKVVRLKKASAAS